MLSNIARAAKVVHAARIVRVGTIAKPARAYSTGANHKEIYSDLQSQLARFDKEVQNVIKPNAVNNVTIEAGKLTNINEIVKQLQKSAAQLQTIGMPDVSNDIRKIIQDELKGVKSGLHTVHVTTGLTLGMVIGTLISRFLSLL